MNQDLINAMNQKLQKLDEAINIKGEKLNDFIARKGSLTKKEQKEAYELQCSYNKSAEEYNAIVTDRDAYTASTGNQRVELEEKLLAKYQVKRNGAVEAKTDFEKPTDKKMDPTVKGALIGGGVSLLALALAVVGIHLYKNSKSGEDSIDVSASPAITASPTPGVQPSPTIDPNLEPGSYGTFLDVNDPEQLAARAEYLMKLDNEYIKKTKEELASKDVTGELVYERYTLEDRIGMLKAHYGLNPCDQNTLTDYNQQLLALGIDLTHHDVGISSLRNWKPCYISLNVPDNTLASEFLKEFEDKYNELAYAATTKNAKEINRIGKELNSLYINKVVYPGIHLPAGIEGTGNYKNSLSIDDIETQYKYTVIGLLLGLKTPVTEIESMYGNDGFCVIGCQNEITGEYEEWKFDDTIEEITSGRVDQEILRTTGEVVRKPLMAEYFFSLLAQYESPKSYTYLK